MKRLLFMLLPWSVSAFAAITVDTPASAPTTAQLGLAEYLEQVKAKNPQARALRDQIDVAELRLKEADVPYSPELYADYNLFDNRAQPSNQFAPSRTQGRQWDVGVRTNTLYGLQASAYFTSQNNILGGLSPLVPAMTSYEQPQLGLKLTQSMWRNAFGNATRHQAEAVRANSRKNVLDAKLQLKNLVLQAENTYWSVVSFVEIIRLQQENVDRAKRLRDYMKQKVAQRLMDDVDFLQAAASHESRELEHKTSVDARSVAVRMFNTLRGQHDDNIEPLSELPKGDLLMKAVKDPNKRMTREDFQSIFESSKITDGQARYSESQIAPQLDLVAGISGNGMDRQTTAAYQEAVAGKYPNWNIGIVFSIPLDYRLIGTMRQSYRTARNSARDWAEQAEYSMRRAWDDLLKQNQESQERFQKAMSIEEIQSQLVERERKRLLDGRSTTFQTTTIETSLAASQISRVQAQLDLIQKHNLIKQFEEQK